MSTPGSGANRAADADFDLLTWDWYIDKSGNWLLRYQTTEGLGKSLNGMSRRLNNKVINKKVFNTKNEVVKEEKRVIIDNAP